VHDLLEMANQRQHGEHRLDEDAVVPLAAPTQFEVGRISLRDCLKSLGGRESP